MRTLLGLIALPGCGICGDACTDSAVVCPDCTRALEHARALPVAVPGVDRAWAAIAYEGVGRRLVGALKFGSRPALAAVAARAVAAVPQSASLRAPLVPVPPDPLRRRIRGFDPAGELAAALGRELGLEVGDVLRRRHGRRQVGRPRSARLAGPSVAVRGPAPTEAVLVDDVITTGATLARCAAALREAGCERVLAVAFARA
jgi:predicted amidophosphoribosyltransferase